jgi:hypothetical protein
MSLLQKKGIGEQTELVFAASIELDPNGLSGLLWYLVRVHYLIDYDPILVPPPLYGITPVNFFANFHIDSTFFCLARLCRMGQLTFVDKGFVLTGCMCRRRLKL